MDVLGIGECMIQLDADGPIAQTPVYTRQVGGDVYNTLVGLSRLGKKTAFLSRVATDSFGEVLLRHFDKEGVDKSYVEQVETGRNGLYFAARLAEGKHEFLYYRERSVASQLAVKHITKEAVEKAQIVYASGVTQAISSSARKAVLKAFQLAKDSGNVVAYDPNYRANLWSSPQDAQEALDDVLPYVDIFLPSLEDLKQILETTEESAVTAYVQSKNVPIVVLKLSEQGSLLFLGDQQELIPAYPPVDIQDTIGAGDAFNAGFLFGLLNEKSLRACAQLGSYVASQSLREMGPILGLPRLTELEGAGLNLD
jgi:2-dehydro-3-deoxygluconokinase